MTIRCVAIDDEKPARDKLLRLLADHPDFQVVGEAADAAAAVRLIDGERPDLCFLDVQMPEGTGFDVLSQVEHLPAVIFTTAYDEYAVRAFEVRSLDYLLKPFGRKRLAEALGRARAALGKSGEPDGRMLAMLRELSREMGAKQGAAAPVRLSGKRGARIVVLDPADVLWFEAEETLVFARVPDGRFLVERTLSELEELLGSAFFRSHRGFLVNLAQIVEIVPGDAGTFEIVTRGAPPGRVPLSRRQARRLRELIPW